MKKGKRTVRPFPYVLVTRVALNFLAKYSHENSRRADLDSLVPIRSHRIVKRVLSWNADNKRDLRYTQHILARDDALNSKTIGQRKDSSSLGPG